MSALLVRAADHDDRPGLDARRREEFAGERDVSAIDRDAVHLVEVPQDLDVGADLGLVDVDLPAGPVTVRVSWDETFP